LPAITTQSLKGEEGNGDLSEQHKYVFSIMDSLANEEIVGSDYKIVDPDPEINSG
jgi:hypothetical protein